MSHHEKPWKRDGDESPTEPVQTVPELAADRPVLSDGALRAELRHVLAALESANKRISALEGRVASLERRPIATAGGTVAGGAVPCAPEFSGCVVIQSY